MKNYFIKEGYKINQLNITNDLVSETNYWNEQRNIAAEVYQFPVYQFLSNYIKRNKVNTIIDIGCGVGRKLEYINKTHQNIKIIGIDQNNPIDYCKKKYNFGTWYIDDFENPSLSEKIKSKLVISSDVIEHLINPDILLNYIKTKLDDDGVVILSTPERDRLRGKNCNYSPNQHHIREWNYDEFEKYIENSGFEILDHFLQFPIKMKLNKIFFNEVIIRFLKLKPVKYNQVIIARVK